jgi:hypothetical protein
VLPLNPGPPGTPSSVSQTALNPSQGAVGTSSVTIPSSRMEGRYSIAV